jgi:hypothetical protein
MSIRFLILLSFLNLGIFVRNLSAQSEEANQTLFYDYQLSTFPQFKSVSDLNEYEERSLDADNFMKGLTRVFNFCSYEVSSAAIFSGMVMAGAGLYPKQLQNSRWIILQLDEEGKVEKLEFFNTELNEQKLECVRKTINVSLINPAFRYNVPVKCRLYVILK